MAAFLETWRAEEAEHARALGMFLDAYAAGRDLATPELQAPPSADPSLTERLVVLLSRPVGHVVTAAHMVWGALNELLTMTGYRLLARRCGHPVLGELLTRIAAQEARQYSFYLLQAEWRLASSRLARVVLPRLIGRGWTPVGVGGDYKAQYEFDRVLSYLAGDASGSHVIERMDARIGRLPAFSELRPYSGMACRALTSPGPATPVPVGAR